MEALNFLVPSRAVSFPPFTMSARHMKKNLHKFHIPISKFRSSRLSPCRLPLSGINGFQIYARFGQKYRRRSSLRRKLLDDQKLRKNPISVDPGTDSRNADRSCEDLGELSISVKETESKLLGESNLLNELENWVARYKEEADYWGVGSNPIFTVFQDLGGKVEKVRVDEDEIMRRTRDFEDLVRVNAKILYAKELASEMEGGENVISRDSSVARFVGSREESGLIEMISNVVLRPAFVPKLKSLGRAVFCGFIVFAIFKTLSFQKKEVKLTSMEKEMMRRKVKARQGNEMLKKGSVEVVASVTPEVSFERPRPDQQELMSSISKAKASKVALALSDFSTADTSGSVTFSNKILEIRDMAKQARNTESVEKCDAVRGGKESPAGDKEPHEAGIEESTDFVGRILNKDSGRVEHNDEAAVLKISDEFGTKTTKLPGSISPHSGLGKSRKMLQDPKEVENMLQPAVTGQTIKNSDVTNHRLRMTTTGSSQVRPRIIRSVKEAREFLSSKRCTKEMVHDVSKKIAQENGSSPKLQKEEPLDGYTRSVAKPTNGVPKSMFDFKSYQDSCLENGEDLLNKRKDRQETKSVHAIDAPGKCSVDDMGPLPGKDDNPVAFDQEYETKVDLKSPTPSGNVYKENGKMVEKPTPAEKWVQKNFHEFEPIVKKIGTGFKENYMVAKEKASEGAVTSSDISELSSREDLSEYEWMRDDKLREIVFQVRDNELAGQDPFHLMDQEDKALFFQGLEKKAEKENQKLSRLHEWLHSNIENLDYGADGISLYDPPEKIIPRWKGPPLEKNTEFLNNYLEQRKALYCEKVSSSSPMTEDEKRSSQLPADDNGISPSMKDNVRKDLRNSRTVIEASDGTAKPGKRSGKEFWQHTKKWSEGFLKSYNEETDPEVKAIMRDIGKDLDRWITEKEIQEAADLMTKQHERNKKYMEKKLNKLRREVELFGPQAVVSKYREYADEKEEDYLWWLDLPHVLCIELYTVNNGEQRVGFYALEMASDLELEPKPHHVIAFEDAADCKSLCYIIQAHLEMLGNGNAFIVPRLPKEAFREAKANGFGVTVIRKGELQLNIDQTLEEVEEQICETGSKFYHDMVMRERSVDISTLMKGVFGLRSTNTTRKRAKSILKRLKKKQT